jgi:hypothetical protein
MTALDGARREPAGSTRELLDEMAVLSYMFLPSKPCYPNPLKNSQFHPLISQNLPLITSMLFGSFETCFLINTRKTGIQRNISHLNCNSQDTKCHAQQILDSRRWRNCWNRALGKVMLWILEIPCTDIMKRTNTTPTSTPRYLNKQWNTLAGRRI